MLSFIKWLAEQSVSADFPKSSSLNRSQLAAIKRYRGQGYMYDIKGSRKIIDDIINKAPPTKTETIVYRGIGQKPKMDKNGFHINDSLVSTSLSLAMAKQYAGNNRHIIKVTIPAGSRVLNMTEYGEDEILLKAQSRFKYKLEPKIVDGYTEWEAVLTFDGSKK